MKTTTTGGEALITASSVWNPELTASFSVTSSLKKPVQNLSVQGVEGNVIVLHPKRILGIICDVTPSDADIRDFDVKLEGAGTDKTDMIASAYKVNYWDENNSRIQFYELSGHRNGECRLTLTAKDGSGYAREYTVRVEDPDRSEIPGGYLDGTIILNEEWFGHTNGGLNYVTPDGNMIYQAYERENPGMSFGCTSQYAAIWGGRLIVASKQAADKGDPLPGGGRLVVADAKTLRRIGSIDNLSWADETKSGDGRAVAGAGLSKVYVGTTQGIYIVDIDDVRVTGKIDTDDAGGQYGDMVRAGKYVFAIRQNLGTLVIDTETDKVVKTIADSGVQGITQSADGNVWIATIADGGAGRFVCIDPATAEERVEMSVSLPAEVGAVACSWGAWRSTQFCGCTSENSLWFSAGGSSIAGGSGGFYRWEIGTDPAGLLPVFSLSNPPMEGSNSRVKQKTYGTIRFDDRSGELIVMTCDDSASGHYRYSWIHFVNPSTGRINRSIALEPYYWFQSLPVFPDKYDAEIALEDIVLDMDGGAAKFDLSPLVTDRDNIDANISLRLEDAVAYAEDPACADVTLVGRTLTVAPRESGSRHITLVAESNGRPVSKTVTVTVNDRTTTGTDAENTLSRGSISCRGCEIVFSGLAGETFSMFDAFGRKVAEIAVDNDFYTMRAGFADGVYILHGDKGMTSKITIRR